MKQNNHIVRCEIESKSKMSLKFYYITSYLCFSENLGKSVLDINDIY